MSKSVLKAVLALSGVLPFVQVHAVPVDFKVVIQQADDNGNLVSDSLSASKTWDLNSEQLWSSSVVDGHVLNDLIPTYRWKNSASLGWGSAAEIYINDLAFDADPLLSFDLLLKNNTAFNQTYSISYNTPLMPTLSGLIDSSAHLTAELSDTGGIAGAKIAPGLGNMNILRAWDITEAGDLVSKNVDLGNVFSLSSGAGSMSWVANNTLVCGTGVDACETMSATLTLTLSKGDQVRLWGEVEQLQSVPVPASVWMLTTGLALVGGWRRLQRRG